MPDDRTVRVARQVLGDASNPERRGATVAVAPATWTCQQPIELATTRSTWMAAHPVLVALDLSVDAGRGREILDGWDPPGAVRFVSGDPVVRLAADGNGVLARLIGAIDVFGRAKLPPWALVGGLAVMVRLAEAHRVTADVYTVADDDTGQVAPALAVLAREQHGTATGSRFVLEDGTNVDIISTGSWTAAELPDDELDRAFILSHWWAVATGEVLDLRVIDGARTMATASAAVATPAAFVACKLQSCRRRQRDPAKAASDISDIYRLLVKHDRDGAVATALARSPEDLGAWCAGALRTTLVTDAARSSATSNSPIRSGSVRFATERLRVRRSHLTTRVRRSQQRQGSACAGLRPTRLDRHGRKQHPAPAGASARTHG